MVLFGFLKEIWSVNYYTNQIMKKIFLNLFICYSAYLSMNGQTSSSFLNIHSYNTEKQAIEVLNHYQKYLLRSDLIHFLAIVYNPNSKLYEIAIGTKKSDRSRLELKNIPPLDVYDGKFSKHQIPYFLPVPSDISNKSGPRDIKSVVNTNILAFSEESDSLSIPSSSRKSWLELPMGALPVSRNSNGDQMGTLGGIFELEEYPDELFGISNWHVICGTSGELGDPIYAPLDDSIYKEIGHLFWKSLDDYREAAFVIFNKKTRKILLDKFENEKIKKISNAQYNQSIYQRGMSSHIDNDETIGSNVYSNYGIIRLKSTWLPNKKKTFYKQLFIKKFTTDGDSGSIAFDISNDNMEKTILGLNFSALNTPLFKFNDFENNSIYLTFSNNITLIFNHTFEKHQTVFYNNKPEIREHFTLKK